MSRVLTVERNPAGTTTTTEQNLDTGTRRHMTYWEGDEIVATALSLSLKDPEQAVSAELQQGKPKAPEKTLQAESGVDPVKAAKQPNLREAMAADGWERKPSGSYEKTFLLDKDRNKGGEFTHGKPVAEKIISVQTRPGGFVMAHGWDDVSVPVMAGLPPAQAVAELDKAAKEMLMAEHGKSLGVTSIRGKGEPEAQPASAMPNRMQDALRREDELLSKQPHEMTFDEFTQVATVQKLGPDHGRQWEVFNGSVQRGESLGFADGPTAEGALRQAHKREVNNALYDHMPDAVHPPGMEPKSMPPQHVLDEYPDLQKKFAPVIEENRKATEYQVMTESSPYEKAVQTFVNGGGNEKDARRILDDVLLSEFSDKNLPKALEFHGFAKPHEAEKLAADIITEENRKVSAKEDRKSSEYQMTKQAEQAPGQDKASAADPAADKSPEPPEADKPERPARPRLRQTHRKAAAMER